MKIHEYQAKQLFQQYAIPIPEGGVAVDPDEAVGNTACCGDFPDDGASGIILALQFGEDFGDMITSGLR